MINKLKEAFKKYWEPGPSEVHVITLNVGGRKLYFSNLKKNEVNFCTLAANAWWFATEKDAKVMRNSLAAREESYDNTKVEILKFKR